MPVTISASQLINRPIADVFRFYADEHVLNHPRWDPNIQLENPTDQPLRVGTVLRRKNTRAGTIVEGTMEVVEFERDRLLSMLIHDGPTEMHGRAEFESTGDRQTRLTVSIAIPAMDAAADPAPMTARLQRTMDNLKKLIESEL